MPIHEHNTISTGYGWVATDGSCLPVATPALAMPTLMQHATWMRRLYNTVMTRDKDTYYRFLLHAYDRGYMLIGRHGRFLAAEACSPTVLEVRSEQLDQICKDSSNNMDTLIPRRMVYSVFDPVQDTTIRRQYFSENLEPPVETNVEPPK